MIGRRLVLAILLVSLATACAPDGPVGEGPSVVATTTILGDVVANIVGEDARVEVLMPAGSDAHEFQASAAQVSRIHQADLVVVNGLGLEEGLLQVLAAAAADGVRVLEVAPPLDPLPLDDGHDHPGDLDPHVWMDPVRMADAVRLIATALTEAAPDVDWEARAEAYAERLNAAHLRIEAELAQVPPAQRVMVTNHASFGYFASRYGWEIVGTVIPGGSSLGSPSAAEIAELVRTITEYGVRVIFVETSQPDDLARVVATEVGFEVGIVALHTESLGDPPADTLIGMLEDNALRITGAMLARG